MSDANTVSLQVNGMAYAGWKSVSITAGIERLARDFTLSVTDRWPGLQAAVVRRIRPGDLCEVFIGGDRVLTGFVDATPVRYDARQVSVGVSGRSKTADLVDCSAINSPGQWRGQRIEAIAAALAAPYGVTVRAEADTGAAVPDHQIQQGETVAESLDRLLRIRRLLASDNGAGELVLLQVGSGGRADTALVLGGEDGNILEGDAPLDFRDRYREYQCKGQRAGDDESFGEAVSGESAATADDAIRRRRVIVFKQTGQADEGTCRDRIDYERAVRAGKSLAATYTVSGWRQGSGRLWLPNTTVRVVDRLAGFDRDMLIAEVEYRLDESGRRAVIKVAPEEAFRPASWKQKRAKSSGDGAEIGGIDEWRNYAAGVS